jgi:hypothetical protein
MLDIVLLGAGASVDAGVPSSFAMTREIVSRIAERPQSRANRVLRFVVGGLLFQQGIRGKDPYAGVDVEDLFNAVLLLGDRENLEAAPFVGSWHSMVDKLDRRVASYLPFQEMNRLIFQSITEEIINAFPSRAPSMGNHDIDRRLQTLVNNATKSASRGSYYHSMNVGVEKAIGEYVVKITDQWLRNLRHRSPKGESGLQRSFEKALEQLSGSGKGDVFRTTAEIMIRALCRIAWIDSAEQVQYLTPLSRILTKQRALTIATLNYDNTVELALRSIDVPFTTGIDRWSTTGEFEVGEEGVTLLKLHGSIDWSLAKNVINESRPMPHNVITSLDADALRKPSHRPAVVFGQRNKLTAEGPFLDLLRAFNISLLQSSRLTVVGYSFRDEHVNEYISQWINRDTSNTLRIIDPSFNQSHVPYVRDLRRHCANRIEVIPQAAATAFASVFASEAG